MNSAQLELICGSLDPIVKPYFRGVYSLDAYKLYGNESLQVNKINIYIVNSQPAASEGEHWLLICRGCRSVFFDSFGKLPTFYGVNVTFDFVNDQRVQGNSRICGLYCVYVARKIVQSVHLRTHLRSVFSFIALNNNDLQVIDWFRSLPYGYLLREDCYSNNCVSYKQLL